MIDFRRSVASSEIGDAIRDAWESAERVRDSLLAAAARQIELSRAAYGAASELCPLLLSKAGTDPHAGCPRSRF